MKSFSTFIDESSPAKDLIDWLSVNESKFKEDHGDSWEDYLYSAAWKLFKKPILESTEPVANTTAGVANPDCPYTVTRFAGHDVIEVDHDVYTRLAKGKARFARWANYVDDVPLRAFIRAQYHNRDLPVMLAHKDTGAMIRLIRS